MSVRIQFDEKNESVESGATKPYVKGVYADERACILIFKKDNEKTLRIKSQIKLSIHPNVGNYLGFCTRENYDIHAFEEETGLGKRFPFAQNGLLIRVQSTFLQILKGVHFIHENGYVHSNLRSLDSFIIRETGFQVVVSLRCCQSLDSVSRNKANDLQDLAHAFSDFFSGKVSSPNRLNIIRGLPEFGQKKILVAEAKDLVQKLFFGADANRFFNHPFLWDSNKRLIFLLDVHEFLNHHITTNPGRPHQLASMIRKIDLSIIGYEWAKLPNDLKLDLLSMPPVGVGVGVGGGGGGRGGGRGRGRGGGGGGGDLTALTFLRGVRNCRAHPFGLKSYNLCVQFDSDPIRGFDFLLSSLVPNFLMDVYDAVCATNLSSPLFTKYVDKGYLA